MSFLSNKPTNDFENDPQAIIYYIAKIMLNFYLVSDSQKTTEKNFPISFALKYLQHKSLS